MIREATPDDKPRLIEMGARFIISSRYHLWLSTRPEGIAALIDRVLYHGVIFVAERDERVIGMLALMVSPHLLTGRDFGEEVAWWVEPEHRNGSAGPRLMHHMECWAMQNRLHMVIMLAPAGSTVGDFYKKCGYQAADTAWVRMLT